MPINTRLLDSTDPDPLLSDLATGFRYSFGNELHRWPWDTTYDDLDQHPFVRKSTHHAFGWPVYAVNLPLRLGRLELGQLEINDPGPPAQIRRSTPVDQYAFEVRLVEHGSGNYWQLKTYFESTLGPPHSGWERTDQLASKWTNDGLGIAITYWFESVNSRRESGYASLAINNDRVYPRYLMDEYVRRFSLNNCLVRTLPEPYLPNAYNYRTSSAVRFTPTPVRDLLRARGHRCALWLDGSRLGVAQAERCLVLDPKAGDCFTLERIDRDRGWYEDELVFRPAAGNAEKLAASSVGSLDEVVNQLAGWGLEVKRLA